MNQKHETIEKKTADAILQRVKAITIGGKEYLIAPPTLATLILVSEAVAELPRFEFSPENIVNDALAVAPSFAGLAEIAAILILGEKRLKTTEIEKRRYLGGLITRRKRVQVDMKKRVADELMGVELKELSNAVSTLLGGLQTEHFFALASFLTAINLTKPTREEAKTTVYGR